MEIVDLKISRSDNRIAKDLCPRNLACTAPDFQILWRSTIPVHETEWTAPEFQIFRSSDLRFPPPFRSTISSPPLFRSTIPVHDPDRAAPEFQIFRSSDLRFPAHRSDLQFPAPLCSDLQPLSTILTGPPPNSRSLDLQIYDFQPTVQIYPCPRA